LKICSGSEGPSILILYQILKAQSCCSSNAVFRYAALILQRRWRGHMVRRFVALTPLRKSKAHAHAACLQRMWRRHFCRHKVRYMFAQRILDVRATRLQVKLRLRIPS
jgi:hypothetical protein